MNKFTKCVAAVLVVLYIGCFFTIAKHQIELAAIKHVVTDDEVTQIYENLLKYTGLPGESMPPLKIIEDDTINAYADFGNWEIGINRGLIDFADSPDEIASALAHEIGHIMMEHGKLNPTGDINKQTVLEGNADKFGIYLMLRAGYDVCQARMLWVKLRSQEGDYEVNSSHPNYSYRTWQLSFPFCGLLYSRA